MWVKLGAGWLDAEKLRWLVRLQREAMAQNQFIRNVLSDHRLLVTRMPQMLDILQSEPSLSQLTHCGNLVSD